MIQHRVRQGETVVGLAKRFGTTKKKILEHPDNRALLARGRTSGILRAGDQVTIPGPENKEMPAATGQCHRFRCNERSTLLKVRFMRENEARANEAYVLRIDLEEISGTLDSDGWLERRIPAEAREVMVLLGENAEEQYRLRVGDLDPVGEVTGLRQRLKNLGYPTDSEDEIFSDDLRDALRRFQLDHGLEETGEFDGATRNELRNAYKE